MAEIFSACANDKSDSAVPYEIGELKIKDQRYPQDFGGAGVFETGYLSGAILDIKIACIPNAIKSKVADYNYSKLEVGGEKAFEEFLNMPGFEKTKYISFLHNNFQYTISEYVYISPSDKGKDQNLRNKYEKTFNGIISSFKFVK